MRRDGSRQRTLEKEDIMSITTIARSGLLPSTVAHRSTQGVEPLRTLRRSGQRRRYLAAKRAHEGEDRTDAYVGRRRRPDVDSRTLVAFNQR
jgi:hypothetical protein